MKPDTALVHAGRHPTQQGGAVNPPVYQTSTVLFPDLATLEAAHRPGPRKMVYGRRGTPTSWALADAITDLEHGHDTVLAPSGLAAVTTSLLSVLGSGDHVLMVDTVYGPTRTFCDGLLARLGVVTTYYDPLIGAGIADLIRPETRAIYLESPGSLTFEVQDLPAIVAVARDRGITTLIDNTWAAGHFLKPLDLGVDIVVHACTKYIVGHSDAMMGSITANAASWPKVYSAHGDLGQFAGAGDMYLAQRGIRTMAVRLARHQETGLRLAHWFADRPEVTRVLHPGLPGDPGHALWQRDFTGASGLFGVLLKPVGHAALAAFLDDLQWFGMGYSWGGFESLVIPAHPERGRTAVPWAEAGTLLRFHAGLEDPDDLITDLEAGFARMAAL